MNFLVLNYEYPPVGNGGGIISRYLSEGLVQLGHSITVVTTWFDKLPETEQTGSMTIIRLKSKRKRINQSNPVEMLAWIFAAKRFLNTHCRSHSFDLAICNFAIPGGEVGRYLKKNFKIPFVVISHGHDIPWVRPESLYFYHFLTYFRIKRICKESALNFIQSAEMKTNINRFLGQEYDFKNIIIPNGVDFNRFRLTERPVKNRISLLFAGRMTAQKRPFTVLKAVRLLQEKSIPFVLKMAGDGPLKPAVEQYIKKNNLSESVLLQGNVSYEDMPALYAEADVLVAPSVSEGMSLVVLEALACGVFPIVTPVSGNTALVRDGINGFFIRENDPSDLAEKIQLFSDRSRPLPAMSVEERISFEQKHQWDAICRQFEKCLVRYAFRPWEEPVLRMPFFV